MPKKGKNTHFLQNHLPATVLKGGFILIIIKNLILYTVTEAQAPVYMALLAGVLAVCGILSFIFLRIYFSAKSKALQHTGLFYKLVLVHQEEERKQIASELHHNIGQSLVVIKNKILQLKNCEPKAESTDEQLNAVTETITNTLQEIRNLSFSLRPYQLDMLGLTYAIRSLAEDMAEKTKVQLTDEIEEIDGLFTPESEISVYRLLQDLLHMMLKPAGATVARLAVSNQNKQVKVWLETNTIILAKQAAPDYTVLALRERVKVLAGTIYSKPAPAGSTCLCVTLPHEKA